jgi:hypothetical protein
MSLTPFLAACQSYPALLKNGVWRFFKDPNVAGINQPFRRKMSLTPFFSSLLESSQRS